MLCVFLGRMNALLASGEVPGLYEGKELTGLMAGCREAAQRDGVLVDSEDELFRRFTTKVILLLLRGSFVDANGGETKFGTVRV